MNTCNNSIGPANTKIPISWLKLQKMAKIANNFSHPPRISEDLNLIYHILELNKKTTELLLYTVSIVIGGAKNMEFKSSRISFIKLDLTTLQSRKDSSLSHMENKWWEFREFRKSYWVMIKVKSIYHRFRESFSNNWNAKNKGDGCIIHRGERKILGNCQIPDVVED